MTPTVFLLAVVGYNSLTHDINHVSELSFHISHSDCRLELVEQTRSGRQYYNQNLICVPVNDHEVYGMLKRGQAKFVTENSKGQLVYGR